MSCKYPETSRSYKFCCGCNDMFTCSDSNMTELKEEDQKVQMKTFLVERMDRYSWCEDYATVVISTDEFHAEKFARIHIEDFKKAKFRVTEINTEEESIVLKANTGA